MPSRIEKRGKLYLLGMMRAIDKARAPNEFWDNKRYSKTYGLRVIKTFEKVNKIPFNPFNRSHLALIKENAVHEHFFRKLRQIVKRESPKTLSDSGLCANGTRPLDSRAD